MSRLDLVIFGATGFTGTYVARELCRIAKKDPGLKWGVAGRSKAKLEELLKDISKKLDEDLSNVKIIVADIQDEKSLKEMCSQCKVLVNCCGPYRHYGEPVVRAAIEGKSHYVDVSGEPQFIETMQLEYDKQARDAGVYIISACGFDSIPNDLGVIFLQQNFGGTLNSVESYLTISKSPEFTHDGVVNYGTWESLVYGLAHFNELTAIRKKMYPERLPPFKPKLKPRSALHQRDASWCLPFPGSDASVVYRTQRQLYDAEHVRPAQIKTYVKFPSLLAAVGAILSSIFLFLMAKFGLTRSLLLKYPTLFTFGWINREPPSEASLNATKYSFELYGEGWRAGSDVASEPPNKKVLAKVSGSNPGYGATACALLYSALTLLREPQHVPAGGGVLTTGVAFRNTKIIQHLNENNMKFEIVNDSEK